MAVMETPGVAFHRLVHAIEAAVASSSNITVEAPKRIRDKDTGDLREHDVVLTLTCEHHTFVIAIECRDRSRPVGVPEIESFREKCRCTGINRGIIVSSLGFAKTALVKADSLEIGCLTLAEVERFNWCLTPGVNQVQRDIVDLQLQIVFAETPPSGWQALLDDGTPVTAEIAANWANHAFDHHVLEDVEGDIRRRFVEENPHVHTISADGRVLAARAITMDVTYRVQSTFVPFEFRRYFDLAKNKLVRDIAIAALSFPDGTTANMLLQEAADGSIAVNLVQVPEQLKKA